MINQNKTMTYRGLAVILGSLGLVAVACSDDDDAMPVGAAGMGGEDSGGTSSNAGTSSAGKTSDAGKGGGGASGGSGGSTAGNGAGGEPPLAGTGAGGELGMAGMDMGGAAGAISGGDGGAGGAPVVVQADTLDWGNFGGDGDWNAVVAAWPMSGDADAATVQKWVWDSQPGVGFYRATAFKVTMSQLVSPLPVGTYSFSLEVDRGDNLNEQYLFAKGCKAGEPDAQSTTPTASGRRVYTLENIEVSSGSCTVGLYTDAPDGGWANVDNAAFVAQ
jgi:hypothetical protein